MLFGGDSIFEQEEAPESKMSHNKPVPFGGSKRHLRISTIELDMQKNSSVLMSPAYDVPHTIDSIFKGISNTQR